MMSILLLRWAVRAYYNGDENVSRQEKVYCLHESDPRCTDSAGVLRYTKDQSTPCFIYLLTRSTHKNIF